MLNIDEMDLFVTVRLKNQENQKATGERYRGKGKEIEESVSRKLSGIKSGISRKFLIQECFGRIVFQF
jgi:hypothetical protein